MAAVDAEAVAELRAAALAQPGAVSRSMGIKFPCPACRAEGYDEPGDNAILFNGGKWGCAWAKDTDLGRKHWEAIGEALGAFTRNGHNAPGGAPGRREAAEAPPRDDPESLPYVFTAALPPEHFVTQFIRYASECVDTAHEYYETTGLILLASATPGVRVRLRQYPRGLSTAFYGVQIGDSTRSRKSTVAGLGLDLLEDALPGCRLANQASPEALLEELAGRGDDSSFWYVDEMGETLDKLHHAKHLAGLRGLLLELYEGRPYRYKRTSKRTKAGITISDEMIIDRPHLCVLGSTTPSIFEIVTARDVASGFLARFAVTMPSGRPPRRGLEEPTEDLTARRTALVKHLTTLYLWARSAPRSVAFVDGALGVIDQFAETVEASDGLTNDRARAMLQRLNTMAVKLAMLAAAGQPTCVDHSGLVVTPADARAAVQIADRWRGYAVNFGERVGETTLEQQIARALKVVQAKGRVPRRVVAQLVHCPKKVMDEIQATLEDRGHITVESARVQHGPASLSWVLLS